MWKSRHSTNHVHSDDRLSVKDYRLEPQEKFEDAMPRMFKGGAGFLRKTETVSSASIAWDMMKRKRRTRKDLDRLYGMSPVPDGMYDMIMRADNGDATPTEMLRLEEYVSEKTVEIRDAKIKIGCERNSKRNGPARLAISPAVSLERIVKQIKEDDDDDR